MHLGVNIELFYSYGDLGNSMEREGMKKCNKMAQHLEEKDWVS